MRNRIILLVTLLVFVTVVAGYSLGQGTKAAKQAAKHENPGTALAEPPASLDKFYPPQAKQPVYLYRMLGLATSFGATMANLQEGDAEHVATSFERFKAEYAEVSKLVPEWEKSFPMGPVEEFGGALKSKDIEKIMPAVEKLSGVCHDCHARVKTGVEFKYHWPDFGRISATDPVTNEDVGFVQLKQFINTNYAGIGADLEEKQIERARQHQKEFRARMQTLKDACKACHEEPVKYFVDETVDGMVDQLGKTLAKPSADPEGVQELLMGIGRESCFKCHLVHMPAALAKHQWRRQ